MFAPGTRLGDYEVVMRVKSGGMATLYLARRVGVRGFAKPVAIKAVHPHLADDEQFVRMFVDEAMLSSRIAHPNVVHVEELREHEDCPYLVMEFVAGVSLRQLLRELKTHKRRLSTAMAIQIAAAIADGLHAAHEVQDDFGQPLNVVHRDVGPDNVLISWQGHVKVIDFGVAKARLRNTTTQAKSLKGKLRYMAPEQATGEEVDRRADIYALGIVLWEMLTTRRLFGGLTDVQVLSEIRRPNVMPPSTVNADIPPALDAVILKALASDREGRFATAKDFRRELLRSYPNASTVESSHVAELLRVIFKDQLKEQQELLATVRTGTTPIRDEDEREPSGLEMLTAELSDVASASESIGSPMPRSKLRPKASAPPAPPPPVAIQAAAKLSTPRVSPPPPPPRAVPPTAEQFTGQLPSFDEETVRAQSPFFDELHLATPSEAPTPITVDMPTPDAPPVDDEELGGAVETDRRRVVIGAAVAAAVVVLSAGLFALTRSPAQEAAITTAAPPQPVEPRTPPATAAFMPALDSSANMAAMVATPMVEAPMVEAPMVATPMVAAPMVEAPMVEAPMVAAPMVEAPMVEAPMVEAPPSPARSAPRVRSRASERPRASPMETMAGPLLADEFEL